MVKGNSEVLKNAIEMVLRFIAEYAEPASRNVGGHQRQSELAGAICQAIEDLGKAYRLDAMAIEQLFFGRSARNVFAVGQARGAALVAAARLGLEVREYTPMQIKQAVTGHGRAAKAQIQAMVKALFGLEELPRPDDAADALAIAACCLNSAALEDALRPIVQGPGGGRP